MIITYNEARELGIWEKICSYSGLNPYVVSEGLLNANEPINVDLHTDDNPKIYNEIPR